VEFKLSSFGKGEPWIPDILLRRIPE